MKELLPLLLYPVIFLVFAVSPLIDRLSGATSPYNSFGLMMTHAITEALWGTSSALVLCVHVTYVVCKRKCNYRKSAPSDYTPVPSTNVLSNYNTMPNEESGDENGTEKFHSF